MKNQESAWLLKEKYAGIENDAFFADCTLLEAGVPLAYLIGQVPFLDCTIYLDSHPLIPRPETEYWVEQAIATIGKTYGKKDTENLQGRTSQILDLCAGSGAIGVAVARAITTASVIFAEIDSNHLPTIEKNLAENLAINRKDLIEKYHPVTSNLFENIPTGTTFDFILTNPPYIDAAANTVDSNVAENEPHLALFGGVAGMEIITRIIETAPAYLNPGGQLWIEHEPAHVKAILELGLQNGYTTVTHPDQYEVPRFSVLSVAE